MWSARLTPHPMPWMLGDEHSLGIAGSRRYCECERRELNPHPVRDRILSPNRWFHNRPHETTTGFSHKEFSLRPVVSSDLHLSLVPPQFSHR
jgi:hypothetical protein